MKFTKIIKLISVLILNLTNRNVNTITVDNQLVSVQSDCFERIAFGAMIPFEKTFRMEDMNLLPRCQELCLKEGERCQTLAFGIHASRNGTCQLSSEKISATNTQPVGTIFDPDFDLYARKTNCFDFTSSNEITPGSVVTPLHDESTHGSSRPPPPPYGTVTSSSYSTSTNDDRYSRPSTYTPSDRYTSTSSDTTKFPASGYGNSDNYPTRRPSSSSNYPTEIYPTGVSSYLSTNGDRIFFSHDGPLYSNSMLYDTSYSNDPYPGVYAGNVPTLSGNYRPSSSQPDYYTGGQPRPSTRPIFGSGYGSGYSYGRPETNRPYDTPPAINYRPSSLRPDTNNRYSTNRPNDYDLPNRPYDAGTRPPPSNNGYDYTRPPSQSGGTRPPNNNGYDYTRPSQSFNPDATNRPSTQIYDRPGGYNQQQQPSQGNGYDQVRPHTLPGSGYIGGTTKPTQHPSSSTNRPQDQQSYSGNPTDRPQTPSGYGGGTTRRPSSSDQNGYGGNDLRPTQDKPNRRPYDPNRPDANDGGGSGGYGVQAEVKPELYPNGGFGGGAGSKGYNDRNPYEMKACFRRMLAGKRISPHWVRRTIACERVEDCMRECSHEKRFQCEGFNYRIDPSGHGQGDCELLELPLSRMDLYSSPQSRDSNLLRHPDYDYYERDRNAPTGCRQSCNDCGSPRPIDSPPIYLRPDRYDDKPPPSYHDGPIGPSSSGYGGGGGSGPPDRYRPGHTAIDQYRPLPPIYISRPTPEDYNRYDFSSYSYYDNSGGGGSGGSYYPRPNIGNNGYGGDRIDRYDVIRPEDQIRPDSDRWQSLPSTGGSGPGYNDDYHHSRPAPPPPPLPLSSSDNDRPDNYRPPYRPGADYSPYRPQFNSGPPSHSYLDRDRSIYNKPKFIPYLIGVEKDYGSYGGSYGDGYSKSADYWGIRNDNRRKDYHDFNYFELGGNHKPPPSSYGPIDNTINTGSRYGDGYLPAPPPLPPGDRPDYRRQWTRRPGPDECSVKSSEGFRLHKGAIRKSYTVPTVTECEKLCSSESSYICQTYSYRYATIGRENCLLCDRPVNLLDYYVDIEPDRNFDIYAMADDHNSCSDIIRGGGGGGGGHFIGDRGGGGGGGHYGGDGGGGGGGTAISDPRNNAQCFFRAIDATRFFKSIVRDSLTVRSVGECELECIKSSKFSCRAFAYRYGQRKSGGIIDNCQLSDWPVRDMDKERHLIVDPAFDVFERASYGHGCEIQPIVDDKHKKLCYLGYGSAAKLLGPAIKKVVTVGSELECKKECIRHRETSSFKCYSFSYGSQASTFNCEMSDLDQSQLKLNIHYAHATDRDYWLFAWNPFDWTCRDKVTTIGGSRVNNDRRMDIFREPGDVTWRHYTVSGKPCRIGSDCEKNLVTGFYSCETDGDEIGSWDYCCKADYPCGYSQGFTYPWCRVGDEPDQWRKCSDRYFPGNNTVHINSGNNLPSTNYHQSNKHKYEHGQQNDFQRPPQPGGLQSLTDFTTARLWPVTYLYSEGPPNSTELSNFVDCNKETC